MVCQNWSTQDKQQIGRRARNNAQKASIARRSITRGSKPRRGVLLLIVLSLLVLFMLVGLSFMVSAAQFSRLAESAAKADEQGMPLSLIHI